MPSRVPPLQPKVVVSILAPAPRSSKKETEQERKERKDKEGKRPTPFRLLPPLPPPPPHEPRQEHPRDTKDDQPDPQPRLLRLASRLLELPLFERGVRVRGGEDVVEEEWLYFM